MRWYHFPYLSFSSSPEIVTLFKPRDSDLKQITSSSGTSWKSFSRNIFFISLSTIFAKIFLHFFSLLLHFSSLQTFSEFYHILLFFQLVFHHQWLSPIFPILWAIIGRLYAHKRISLFDHRGWDLSGREVFVQWDLGLSGRKYQFESFLCRSMSLFNERIMTSESFFYVKKGYIAMYCIANYILI